MNFLLIFKRFKLTLLASLACLQFSAIANTTDWKVWKQQKTLSVSSRRSNIDNLTEIKATVMVKSTISGFLSFIQDLDNTPKWLTNADESEIIKVISATEHIFTVNFSAIWPLKARHLQLHSTYWQNNDLSVEIELTDDFTVKNKTDNSVRAKVHQSHWLIIPNLTESKEKQLTIEYTFIADSGGKVPRWLADQLALKSTLKSMKKIRQLLPESKWQLHKTSGIKELQ